MSNQKLEGAVRAVLTASALAAVSFQSGVVQAQSAEPAPERESISIGEIVVTGTRLRRSEVETASPLTVIDQIAIERSGVAILGDLLQTIPEVSGISPNPQLANFRNGTGVTGIGLRAFGAGRTLILLDGRRLGGGSDVNKIPVNLVERIEVLKEGAGVIYGSDAIGGVVNIITKKPTDGIEVRADYGETSQSDGEHHSAGLTFGTSSERSETLVGGYYSKQEGITAAQRAYSQVALYLYSGVFTPGGISATPTGRIFLPPALRPQFGGCTSVTRAAGAAGTNLADFGCFGSGGPYAGTFNYQPYNLLLSPQERGSVFFKSKVDIGELAEAYATVVYNRTHASSQNSAGTVFANSDEVVISANSIYNPFGINFGGGASVGGVNPDAQILTDILGVRDSDGTTTTLNLYAGLRGSFPGSSSWQWDASVGYNRLDQELIVHGFALTSALNAAFGPSFIASDGTPRCGTVAQPIANCVPANFFNLAATPDALANIRASMHDTNAAADKLFNLDLNGTIASLPAGELLASVGVGYIEQEGSHDTNAITRLQAPLFRTCGLARLTCSSPFAGSFNVKEAYGELFVPLLKDLPAINALNIGLGVRHSEYSLFGDTDRGQFKLEYRPVRDLLIRGTYTQVFRAPGISEAFGGPSGGLVSFTDPCARFTGAATAEFPNLPAACVGVPTDGSFVPLTNQVPSLSQGNRNLKPEEGYVATGGFVFSPQWAPNFSLTADYWHSSLSDVISGISPNFGIQECARTGAAEYCDLAVRFTSGPNQGHFIVFNAPTFNLGTLEVSGVDVGVKYELRDTALGSWRLTLDVTRTNSFKTSSLPGAPQQDLVGTYARGLGNLADTRGLLGLGWSGGQVDGLLTVRYIGSLDIPDARRVPSFSYINLSAGYTLPSDTRLQVTVHNLADKDPPIFGANWASAGGLTDHSNYDEIGRRYMMSIVHRF